ncbi:MAG: GNAT family N-acetyltransferase [Treponemataceae bacterium]
MTLRLENITQKTFKKTISFLLSYEKYCLSLWNFFYINDQIILPKNSENFFLIIDDEYNKIEAVIFKRKKGSILHCFSFSKLNSMDEVSTLLKTQLASIVQNLFADGDFSSIAGSMHGTKFILENCKKKLRETNDYYLLEHKKSSSPCSVVLPNKFFLQLCTPNDAENLYHLQRMYELVEVLPRGKKHNKLTCMLSLQKSLARYPTYAICAKTTFIAKAGINAISPHCGQIGGVFTHSQYRANGFAKFLVSHLQQDLAEKQKSCILFVRKTNLPAIKAYTDIGFFKIGNYTIAYFD